MMSSANGMTFSTTFTIIAKDSQGLSKNPLSRFSPCLTDFLCPPITDLRNTLMEKTLAHDIIRCHHDAAGDDPGNRINDREQREIRHPPENRHDEENTQQAGTEQRLHRRQQRDAHAAQAGARNLVGCRHRLQRRDNEQPDERVMHDRIALGENMQQRIAEKNEYG